MLFSFCNCLHFKCLLVFWWFFYSFDCLSKKNSFFLFLFCESFQFFDGPVLAILTVVNPVQILFCSFYHSLKFECWAWVTLETCWRLILGTCLTRTKFCLYCEWVRNAIAQTRFGSNWVKQIWLHINPRARLFFLRSMNVFPEYCKYGENASNVHYGLRLHCRIEVSAKFQNSLFPYQLLSVYMHIWTLYQNFICTDQLFNSALYFFSKLLPCLWFSQIMIVSVIRKRAQGLQPKALFCNWKRLIMVKLKITMLIMVTAKVKMVSWSKAGRLIGG